MTLKNRTSNKHRKPAVYVDQSNLQKESNVAFIKQVRAKKFAAIRGGVKPPVAGPKFVPQPIPVAAAAAAEPEAEADDAAVDETADGDASEEAPVLGLDGFTVAFAPYRSTDSSTLALTTTSALKDEKVLGVALWEWLLGKLDWDCHTLWERFMHDWDLITETERPPGTNRPLNLHSYLSYLRSTNNKHLVRKDIRDVREILRQEREANVRDHAHDDILAVPNLQALNGTLLQYYLKIKNLVPYESDSQRKKKMHQEKKRKAEAEAEAAEPKPAEEEATTADEIVEAKLPQKKKQKRAPVAAVRPSPPTSSLVMGRASCFAALLDCD